jgi:hypothetical protein
MSPDDRIGTIFLNCHADSHCKMLEMLPFARFDGRHDPVL